HLLHSSNTRSAIFSQNRTTVPTAAAAQLRNLGRTCFRQMTKAPIREGGMGMVHTAHHTLAQQTFRLAGIIEKSLPYPHNCLQKLKFKLAKTNYTHYTSSYTETQQTRAFSDHFALWKCGKRLLRRWKADIHGPMEKPPAFPQPANIVSHSSASMTVYAHSHSAYYGEYPSCPILLSPA